MSDDSSDVLAGVVAQLEDTKKQLAEVQVQLRSNRTRLMYLSVAVLALFLFAQLSPWRRYGSVSASDIVAKQVTIERTDAIREDGHLKWVVREKMVLGFAPDGTRHAAIKLVGDGGTHMHLPIEQIMRRGHN